MIKTKIINNTKIHPIVFKTFDPNNIRGGDMINDPYASVFISARRKSGKTTTIYNMMENIASPKNRIFIFCSSIDRDEVYLKMKEMLEEKGCLLYTFKSIKEGKEDNLKKVLEILDEEEEEKAQAAEDEKQKKEMERKMIKQYGRGSIQSLKQKNRADEELINYKNRVLPPLFFSEEAEREYWARMKESADEEKEEREKCTSDCGCEESKKRQSGKGNKKKRKKLLGPNIIFLFDDLPGELKTNKNVEYLIKTGRHMKAMTIISSQSITDLPPSCRSNFTHILLFRGIDEDKLMMVKDNALLSLPIEKLLYIYKLATKEKYNFLFIDVANQEYRRNFNEQILINDLNET